MKFSVDAEVSVKQISANYTNETLHAQGSIVAMGRGDTPIDVQLQIPLDKKVFSDAITKMKSNEMDVPPVEVALAMVQSALARKFALSIKDEG